MSVSREDVQHVAALARLAMTDERASEFTEQLNSILSHMSVLASVETDRLEPIAGVGADSAPLQADEGPPVRLEVPIDELAPRVRDGFFLVPRLDTHETPGQGSA